MSSSKLKKVLIAESSHTMANILAMQLKDIYEVSISYDGCDALQCLLTNEYDCALLSIDLPILGGFSLTRIIKKTASIKHIAVVCFSSEDNFSKRLFWSNGAGVDETYVITDDDGESLRNCVKKALSVASGEIEFNKEKQIQKKATVVDLLPIMTDAYEKQLFEYYVLQFAYSCNVQIQDLQGLKSLQELKFRIQKISQHIVQQMAECLFGICNYSSLIIFINLDAVDGTVLEFADISSGLPNDVRADFENICKSDFEKAEMDRADHYYSVIDIEDSFVSDDKSSALQSYEYFLLATDEFSGSIHIAQRLQNYFGNKYHDRIVYFAEVFSPIIENVVKSYRSKCIEIKMKLAFSRFVPEEIINDLITNENSVIERGATRNICIFIVDIRDFTSISEINEPSEVVDFLNTYFTRAVEIVKKYGGTVDKFMGDAIMALFGAPENLLRKASADDKTEINCSCALAAAVELIREYPKIPVNQIKIPAGKKFNIGIGIHYGNVIVGSLGSKDRHDYSVIGDTVNIASRIQDLNKIYGTHIVVTDEVWKHSKDELNLEGYDIENTSELFSQAASTLHGVKAHHLDNVKVKGKKRSVAINSLDVDEIYSNAFYENQEKAFTAYEIGNWYQACNYFHKALEIVPNNKATEVLYKRCCEYAQNPPEQWDGSITLTSK